MHALLKNRAISMALVMVTTIVVLIIAGFIAFITSIKSNPHKIHTTADAIVVLTGGPFRIEKAVNLLSEGKGKRLLISGVHPATSRRDLSRLVPNHKRMFTCCIDIDHIARDTIGNAAQTRNWMKDKGFNSVIVVTASYHMPRSMLELRRAMPTARLIPFPVSARNIHMEAWWAYPGTLWLLTKEYFKTLPALVRLGAARLSYYVAG